MPQARQTPSASGTGQLCILVTSPSRIPKTKPTTHGKDRRHRSCLWALSPAQRTSPASGTDRLCTLDTPPPPPPPRRLPVLKRHKDCRLCALRPLLSRIPAPCTVVDGKDRSHPVIDEKHRRHRLDTPRRPLCAAPTPLKSALRKGGRTGPKKTVVFNECRHAHSAERWMIPEYE
ncbi:hypothetical protein MMC06_002511 [Schaereria dolodes]|nr:hypothetical protein [Schaereria dolodes]